jgi:hypothetical protein
MHQLTMTFDFCVIPDTESNLYIGSTSNCVLHDQSCGAGLSECALPIGQSKQPADWQACEPGSQRGSYCVGYSNLGVHSGC